MQQPPPPCGWYGRLGVMFGHFSMKNEENWAYRLHRPPPVDGMVGRGSFLAIFQWKNEENGAYRLHRPLPLWMVWSVGGHVWFFKENEAYRLHRPPSLARGPGQPPSSSRGGLLEGLLGVIGCIGPPPIPFGGGARNLEPGSYIHQCNENTSTRRRVSCHSAPGCGDLKPPRGRNPPHETTENTLTVGKGFVPHLTRPTHNS